MNTLRIAICGITGRMGHALISAAQASGDLSIAGGITAPAELNTTSDWLLVDASRSGELLANADVLIDFSAPDALSAVLSASGGALRGKGLVVGTTGLTSEHESQLRELSQQTAIVTAANFSVGVNLLLDLVRRAARVLDEGFDLEIIEAHHRNKVDAPSGTALALGRAAAEGRSSRLDDVRRDGRSGVTGKRPAGEIGMHALRGGSVVGEHHVIFLGDAERIELTHVATDRSLFAQGALTAARWVAGRAPGLYTMSDVLNL